jgi:hypothetical protein
MLPLIQKEIMIGLKRIAPISKVKITNFHLIWSSVIDYIKNVAGEKNQN